MSSATTDMSGSNTTDMSDTDMSGSNTTDMSDTDMSGTTTTGVRTCTLGISCPMEEKDDFVVVDGGVMSIIVDPLRRKLLESNRLRRLEVEMMGGCGRD